MRNQLAAAAALAVGFTLVACSNPSQNSSAGNASPAPAPAPAPTPAAAPALTDADKKALLATLPAAYQGADLDNGQAKFALCKACHTYAQGGDAGVGPNLWGIFGRKSGSAAGFSYSDGLKALNVTWDADKLNTWITKPSAMVSGTKMTYAGMESAKDRIDVIAYLKTVSSPAPAK